jgi:hypothetical protein
MEVKTQTVEQFLFEQLQKVAPGKYTIGSVLDQFKGKLRFACNHLKGGSGKARYSTSPKDYNLSIFTFPNGVTEVKCLYNCGLKIRSDEKDLTNEFNQLYDLPSTNHKASAEVKGGKIDPGPAPVYTDAQRQRIKESADIFFKGLVLAVESGRVKQGDPVLGGVFPHPDPIEAPDSIIERAIKTQHVKALAKKMGLKAVVVAHDKIPALVLVKKIRKTRKTKSRQRKRSGK